MKTKSIFIILIIWVTVISLPFTVMGYTVNHFCYNLTAYYLDTICFYPKFIGYDHYLWNFNDSINIIDSAGNTVSVKATSSLQNPCYAYYSDSGKNVSERKMVILKAWNDTNIKIIGNPAYKNFITDTVTDTIYIYLTSGIVPQKFCTDTIYNICAGEQICFDSNLKYYDNYKWNFSEGDSTTIVDSSRVEKPCRQYNKGGTYFASLDAYDGCENSLSKYHVVIHVTPNAEFLSMMARGCLPLQVDFINETHIYDTLTYQWNFGDGDTSNAINPVHQYTVPGTYSVTLNVADTHGCSDTAVQNIIIPEQLLASVTTANISCPGGNNGSINLTITGGTSPYSYLWSNGEQTQSIASLQAGNYSVTVTDANGCTADASTTITEPAPLQTTPATTDVRCYGESNGSASLTVTGGTAPYSYLWNNGEQTQNIASLPAGTYSVTVTDANGCTAVATATITEPAPMQTTLTTTAVRCYGESNGSASLTVTGGTTPYTYLWSNGATTEDLSNLTAGTYALTVTDASGCTAVATATITEPPLLTATIANFTNVSCNGGNDGSINISVTGGTSPYTYLWSNGATTESLYNLSAGNYNVTVTDANGCTTTTGVLLTEPALITATAVATPVSCGGGSDGAIDLTVNGGTPPYYYYWSNGFTMEDLSNITAGMYTVSVIDNRGCTTSLTVEVITTEPNCVPVANTISGKIYHNPACYQNPAASISIDLKNENGGTFFSTTTDANGNFAFDPNMLQTIPPNWLVTIGSNSTPVQDMGFQTVSQWISQSPLTIATDENMPLHASWESRVNLATNIYNPYSWPSAIDINGDLVVAGLSNTEFNTWEIVTLKYNTSGNLLWTNTSVPSSSQPALALDNQGNIYVTGNTQGANNALDFVTVKYASDGTELWINTYNGSGSYSSDNPIDIKTDSNGNVYVTGSSNDASGNYGITTVKYNTNGDLLWSKQYNGMNNSEDIPVDMALDNNGNVYVVGRTTTYSGTMSDFVTIKYDNDGNEQWVALYDYSNWHDNPVSITVAQNGDVFVAGRVMSPDNNMDYATIKYSDNGTQQWVKFYTGPTTGFNSHEEPLKIVSDNNNDVYVTGITFGSTPNAKLATLKYSNSGEKLWERTFTTNGSAKDMAIGNNNSIYITSQYVSIQTGNVDFLTLSYSSEGVQQWWVTYDYQNYSEEPSAVCVDNAGNCYVTGSGSSMNNQNVDIITLRYDACPLMGYSKISNTKTYSLNEEAKKTTKSNKSKVVQMQANGNQSINAQYYPNPATHELIVKVNVEPEAKSRLLGNETAEENYELTITNLLGQKVITKRFTGKTTLDVSDIRPKGLYFIQVMKDDGTQISVGKLVIGE